MLEDKLVLLNEIYLISLDAVGITIRPESPIFLDKNPNNCLNSFFMLLEKETLIFFQRTLILFQWKFSDDFCIRSH